MGTNFYHRTAICECCGRYDETHIGKNHLMFQGYPDLGILSWNDWKLRLRAGGEVWDEYGVKLSTDEFISDVEKTHPADRRRQYDWEQDHPLPSYADQRKSWLDPHGFSFHEGDFW